jgi:hypothetical protein
LGFSQIRDAALCYAIAEALYPSAFFCLPIRSGGYAKALLHLSSLEIRESRKGEALFPKAGMASQASMPFRQTSAAHP